MSNMFSGANASLRGRSLPDGETVGRYGSYLDAQKAVDYLADHDFPVQHVSIVGNDLKSVEVVTGKLSYPRVALSGAASGAMFGLFIGLLFSLFGGSGGGLAALIPSVLIGAVFWMIIGVVSYAMQRGKRDFSSTSQVIASSFDVVVDREVSGQARNELQNLQVRQVPTDPRSLGPQYGGPQGPQYGGPQGPQYGGPQGPQYGGQQGRPPAGPQYGPPQPGPYGQPPAGNPGQPGPWAPPSRPGVSGQPVPGQPQGGRPGGQPGPYTGPAYQPQRGGQGGRGDEPFDGQRPDNGDPRAGDAQPGGSDRSTPRGQFPDLPDGRPQFGVRVDPAQQRSGASAAGSSAVERTDSADSRGGDDESRPAGTSSADDSAEDGAVQSPDGQQRDH